MGQELQSVVICLFEAADKVLKKEIYKNGPKKINLHGAPSSLCFAAMFFNKSACLNLDSLKTYEKNPWLVIDLISSIILYLLNNYYEICQEINYCKWWIILSGELQ